MFQQLQIRPKVRFATSDSRAAIAMVRAGLGITLLNDILTADLADGVAVLPLDPPQSVHLGIALPEEEHVSPAAKRFITYALDRLPGAGCSIGTSIPDRASKSDKNVSQLYKPAIFVCIFCEKPENSLLSWGFQALLLPCCGGVGFPSYSRTNIPP